MSLAEGWPDLTAPKRTPYGLVSLAEMVNFSLYGLCRVCAQLMYEVISLERAINDRGEGHFTVSDEEKGRAARWLDIIANVADQLEWQAVNDRIAFFRKKLGRDMNNVQFHFEFVALKETIEKGIENQYGYRYPKSKLEILVNWQKDWKQTLQSFPSAEADILATVDCWALGHSTATVFHAMRVLEHGLGALAAELGRNYETQQWYNIINEIESEIRKLGNLPKSAAKNERMRFLAEAAKEFVYFKDA